jgi:hypothetical protein
MNSAKTRRHPVALLVVSALLMAGQQARAQYHFTTLDVPDVQDTFLYSLNNQGAVVGQGLAADGSTSVGALFVQGQFFSYSVPGATYTELDSLNDRGDLTGSYVNAAGIQEAFTLFDGARSDFTATRGALYTVAGGLNNRRDLAGTFTEDPNFESIRAFTRIGGSVVPFDFPGSDVVVTQAFNLNDNRQVVGWYRDSRGSHGYVRNGDTFASLDYPHAVLTRAFGINNSGAVTGYFRLVPGGPFRGFVWFRGDFVTVELPRAVGTFPQAINDRGELAGYYRGTDGRFHGFVALPEGLEEQ